MNTNSNATMLLDLGILSIVILPILGPIAWVIGNNSRNAIGSGLAAPQDHSNVAAGRVCGIIDSILLALASVMTAIYLAFGFVILRVVTKMTQDADFAPSPFTISHKHLPKFASLSSAIVTEDKNAFGSLLAKDLLLANKQKNVRQTLPFDAASAGRKEMAPALITHGAQPGKRQ